MKLALARKDYYVEDPSRLKGKPKLTIGDYVESAGIPGLYVPRRYATFRTAKREVENGGTVLFRNEHECEYDGPSGLGRSIKIDSDGLKNIKMPKKGNDEHEILRITFSAHLGYSLYCELMGIDFTKFSKNFTFSYWEYIPGTNVTVVADSSIADRYHVMIDGKIKHYYAIVEGGKIAYDFSDYVSQNSNMNPLTPEMAEAAIRITAVYEQIRNLGNFNPLQCPIMEFKIGNDGKDYFLQYHRTRDFCQSTFTLDDPKPGWIETIFARGATPTSEGRIVRTGLKYYWSEMCHENSKIEFDKLRAIEQGSKYQGNNTYNEIQARTRLLHIVDPFPRCNLPKLDRSLKASERLRGQSDAFIEEYKRAICVKLSKVVCGHSTRSVLFKPEVSVIQNIAENVGSRLMDEIHNIVDEKKTAYFVDLHVVSDGRRAFVKLVE
jgi:hypothetical protein